MALSRRVAILSSERLFGRISLDLLCDLNDPQRQAVTHIDGPLLVLAGAGSGKTRVITRRVAYLAAQGVAPWNILAITFTNKAAGEMRQRVADLAVSRGATVCTFHSLCARLLREFAGLAGLHPNFSIYDQGEQVGLVKQAIEKLDLKSLNLMPSYVHAAISRAKNDLADPAAFAAKAEQARQKRIAEIYAEYQKLLAANNALDFDDLLFRMACLLRDRPDVRQLLGQRYRYILIDEYQDTNRAQYVIAHGIAVEHQNIAVTGDPDQSIYAWRGADIHNILDFEKDYPNAIVVRLEENYRSTTPILGAAGRLIARNLQRKEKSLWTRRTGGGDVRVVFCDDENAEADQVALRIQQWQSQGRLLSDVAVFYRVNALSRVLERALIKAAVPYRVARGVEFYGRREIKDALAYLRLLVNPADDVSCRRVLNVPARGIGKVTEDRLGQLAATAGVALLEACGRADKGAVGAAAEKLKGFAALIAGLSSDLNRPVRTILEDVLRRSGLEGEYAGAAEDQRQARANLAELVTAAGEFDAAGGGTLGDYLQQVSLVSDTDHFEGSQGAVTLMTLHAAKGLEFPAVFIVGCEEGLLPFIRQENGRSVSWRAMEPQNLEEERRLAFVGMTRAMELLTISAARHRTIRGQFTAAVPSPFLNEIAGESVSLEDATTAGSGAPADDGHDEYRGRGGRYGGGGRHGGGGEVRHHRGHTRAGDDFYADSADRAAIESAVDAAVEQEHPYPSEYEHLRAGCMVRHPTFGAGRVVSLHTPWPETRAIVEFQRHGRKTLVLRLARLELM